MNFKVTATPNGKGKVKITVTNPDGTSWVYAEKAKEGRFTHYAVVTQEITQAAIDRHISFEKRHWNGCSVDRPYLEGLIGEFCSFIQMSTKESTAKKAGPCLPYAEAKSVEVFEVEAV